MKRFAAMALVPLLAGCGPTTPNIDTGALEAAVAQIRGYTIQICSYIPTNQTVVEIITASGAIVTGAYKVAVAICEAVQEPVPPLNPAQMGQEKMGEERQCPMVNGVCIEGRFVKSEDKPKEQ